MDLHHSLEQRELMEAVRAVCGGVAEVPNGPAAGISRLRAVAELGVFDLRVPLEAGGLGLGVVEAALIVEEAGAALLPTSLISTHLAHTWLSEARFGDWHVGEGHRVEGLDARWVVETPTQLTHLVVEGRALRWLRLPEEEEAVAVASLDPQAQLHSVTSRNLDEAATLDGAPLRRYRMEDSLLRAAYQVGVAQQVLDRSVRYAGERHQFGRAIGSFQAVKHLLADMLVATEVARSAVLAGSVALDDDELVAGKRLTAAAVRLANRAATSNGRKGIQVHGGMGFAWEVDIHLFLKRAWTLAATIRTDF